MPKKQPDIFSDSANHDIKSLITSIKSYSQLLIRKSKNSLDNNTFEYLISLDKQVDDLIKYIDKLDNFK